MVGGVAEEKGWEGGVGQPAQAPADKFITGVWTDDCVVQLGVWDGM